MRETSLFLPPTCTFPLCSLFRFKTFAAFLIVARESNIGSADSVAHGGSGDGKAVAVAAVVVDEEVVVAMVAAVLAEKDTAIMIVSAVAIVVALLEFMPGVAGVLADSDNKRQHSGKYCFDSAV